MNETIVRNVIRSKTHHWEIFVDDILWTEKLMSEEECIKAIARDKEEMDVRGKFSYREIICTLSVGKEVVI